MLLGGNQSLRKSLESGDKLDGRRVDADAGNAPSICQMINLSPTGKLNARFFTDIGGSCNLRKMLSTSSLTMGAIGNQIQPQLKRSSAED